MKRQYDFSKARRGPVRITPGNTGITIRLDNDVIEHFQAVVDRAGGGNYQTLINDALREYIRGTRLEIVVRRAVQQEVARIRGLRRAWKEGVESGDGGQIDFAELRRTAKRELAARKSRA